MKGKKIGYLQNVSCPMGVQNILLLEFETKFVLRCKSLLYNYKYNFISWKQHSHEMPVK